MCHDETASPPKRQPPTTLDLNYPYSYQPSQPEINPPLIDIDGPLYVENGKLNVAVTPPVSIVNKRIGLSIDNTSLEVEENKLGVKLDPQGALQYDTNGIAIVTDSTLQITDWELGVKIADEQPIDFTAEGLVLNVDDTLLVDQGLSGEHELGVHLNPQGPINADHNGLDIDYDESLQVTQFDTVYKLGIKVDSAAPLLVTGDGLSLKIDQSTLEVKDGKLNVKDGASNNIAVNNTMTINTANGTTTLGVKVSGVIVGDNSGVRLLYDTSDFIDNSSVGLQAKTPISYLSPYCTFESGDKALNTFTSQVRSNNNVNWPCSYYIFMANSSGVVNASMMFLLDKNNITNMGPPPGTTTTFRATFVLNISGDYQTSHSMSSSTVTTCRPNVTSTRTFFVPNQAITSVDCYNLKPISSGNYYISDPKGQVIELNARGQEYRWKTAHVTITPAKVLDIVPIPPAVIALSFYGGLTGQNWYDRFIGSYLTGPFCFSYQGSVPDFSRS